MAAVKNVLKWSNPIASSGLAPTECPGSGVNTVARWQSCTLVWWFSVPLWTAREFAVLRCLLQSQLKVPETTGGPLLSGYDGNICAVLTKPVKDFDSIWQVSNGCCTPMTFNWNICGVPVLPNPPAFCCCSKISAEQGMAGRVLIVPVSFPVSQYRED